MISGQFPPRVSSGVRPCRVHTASMIDTLSENCFSSGFKFMSHSGGIMPHVKVDQAISLHTTPSFFSPSTGEGEYLPFFFPFLIISLPTESAAPSPPRRPRRFPFPRIIRARPGASGAQSLLRRAGMSASPPELFFSARLRHGSICAAHALPHDRARGAAGASLCGHFSNCRVIALPSKPLSGCRLPPPKAPPHGSSFQSLHAFGNENVHFPLCQHGVDLLLSFCT